jgi:flagellar basal body-associated protein FliL
MAKKKSQQKQQQKSKKGTSPRTYFFHFLRFIGVFIVIVALALSFFGASIGLGSSAANVTNTTGTSGAGTL